MTHPPPTAPAPPRWHVAGHSDKQSDFVDQLPSATDMPKRDEQWEVARDAYATPSTARGHAERAVDAMQDRTAQRRPASPTTPWSSARPPTHNDSKPMRVRPAAEQRITGGAVEDAIQHFMARALSLTALGHAACPSLLTPLGAT